MIQKITSDIRLELEKAGIQPGLVRLSLGYTGTLVTAFALRQSTFTDKIYVDNVGVGDSFTDAFTAGPTPVEGTTWGKLKALYR